MTMTPHIDASSPDFPGDPTPQPPFGFKNSVCSAALWFIGLSNMAVSLGAIRAISHITGFYRADFILKAVTRIVPALVGVKVKVQGADSLDRTLPYVYIANHVNIFDMFVIYQSVPQYTRALEHIDHFSWPIIGPLLKAAGQIPVDPDNPRQTARSLKTALDMLKAGHSLTVLPEGTRTLDGSLGPFHPGAFRLAIRAGVPIVPIAIRGGRAVSRRGDWRIRPGIEEVLIAAPLPTDNLRLADAPHITKKSRQIIIDLLHRRHEPGT